LVFQAHIHAQASYHPLLSARATPISGHNFKLGVAETIMPSVKQQRDRTWLRKKAKKGIRGYPAATVAFYGPDNRRASKVAVAIIPGPDEEPSYLERWYSDTEDLRTEYATTEKIVEFIKGHGVTNIVMADAIIGCPHEEDIDYPEGQTCPERPFWENRDRWSGLSKQ
jgi:hypothetical protein